MNSLSFEGPHPAWHNATALVGFLGVTAPSSLLNYKLSNVYLKLFIISINPLNTYEPDLLSTNTNHENNEHKMYSENLIYYLLKK